MKAFMKTLKDLCSQRVFSVMNSYNRELIMVTLFSWSFMSVSVGAFNSQTHQDGCEFKSIISRLNPPYVITCILFKPRWKNGN